jgi:hypothetical protein
MIDAVDSFLNNAVDIYIQAVEYCQLSTSQIPTPFGAGTRRNSADIAGFWRYRARFRPDWPERPGLRQYGRIRPHSLITGLDLARTAGPSASGQTRPFWPGSRPGRPVSGQLAEIRPFSAGFRQLCWNLYLQNIKKIFLY